MMTAEKRTLTLTDLDTEAGFVLPPRETMALVTIVINNVLNNNTVTIDVRNVQVAAQICAALLSTGNFDCDFTATN